MKILWYVTTMLLFAGTAVAQAKKAAPTAKKSSTATKSKRSTKKATGKTEFDELICYEDGPCTFSIHKGDTLVYDVNAAGKQYTLFAIPNKFDAAALADFNWVTSAPDSKSGHVTINAKALKSSKRYMNILPSGDLKLTDATSLWFCADNFSEITKKPTSLSLDNNSPESFSSPDDDAVSINVNYKGKDISLDGFAIQTKPEGEPGRKEIWILNISSNLLIIKMDVGWTMQLKEVRARKIVRK
jgi:hypothetical protein